MSRIVTLLFMSLFLAVPSLFGVPLIKIQDQIHPVLSQPAFAALKAVENVEEINILIDSEGGYADVGKAFAEVIRARTAKGLTTNCYALNAISAAFYIWASCNKRYVAPYGAFMMHYIYLIPRRVTVWNMEPIRAELQKEKILMDSWLLNTFGAALTPTLQQMMREEEFLSGKELCKRLLGFCKPMYVIDFLE